MAARHRKIDLPEVNGQLRIPNSWPELDRIAWHQVIDGQPERISLRETMAMRRRGSEPSRSTRQSGRRPGRRARQQGPRHWSADRCKQHAATFTGLWLASCVALGHSTLRLRQPNGSPMTGLQVFSSLSRPTALRPRPTHIARGCLASRNE